MILHSGDYRRGMAQVDRATDESVGAIDFRVAELARRWAAATRNMSSLTQMRRVPEFEELVALGRDAAPALLGLYRSDENGHLFLVLQTITGENPVPTEANGDPEAIRQSWLEWGRRDASDHG